MNNSDLITRCPQCQPVRAAVEQLRSALEDASGRILAPGHHVPAIHCGNCGDVGWVPTDLGRLVCAVFSEQMWREPVTAQAAESDGAF
jgi:hypothetical protein